MSEPSTQGYHIITYGVMKPLLDPTRPSLFSSPVDFVRRAPRLLTHFRTPTRSSQPPTPLPPQCFRRVLSFVVANESSHIVHGRKEYRLESTAIAEIQKKVDSSLGVKVQNTDSLAVLRFPTWHCDANRWVRISLLLYCMPLFLSHTETSSASHFPFHHGLQLRLIHGQVPRPQEPCTGRRQHPLCQELRGCRLPSA